MKILFVSAEVSPYAKQGGMGDVVGSLPKALAEIGHDVRIVLPAYQFIEERNIYGFEPMPQILTVPMGDTAIRAGILKTTLPDSTVPVYAIAEQYMLGRPEVYGYEDDAYRFAFFSRAALDLTKALMWQPDIVHAHDWHTAAVPFWLATSGRNDNWFLPMQSVYTIHNLAYQGKTDWSITHFLKIMADPISQEDGGQINLMARGIFHAGRVTTVSPNYAEEILTPVNGEGLHKLLQFRKTHVSGILNGLDVDAWNPETDSLLPQTYGKTTLEAKKAIRPILQDSFGLPQRDDVPIIGVISRLVWQKGIDLIGRILHPLLRGDGGEAQFVVLGTGEEQYENMFELFAQYYPKNMGANITYSNATASLMYGGCDMLLVPSLFEPCGLTQMIAMRYGTIPIVRNVGGLHDTVTEGETGFLFDEYTRKALWTAVKRALAAYNDSPLQWKSMQLKGMKQDFRWDQSAKAYETLYKKLLNS